jgi:hypothetical protein
MMPLLGSQVAISDKNRNRLKPVLVVHALQTMKRNNLNLMTPMDCAFWQTDQQSFSLAWV